MTEWIRTADKLPEPDYAVLAFAKGEGVVIAYYNAFAKGRWWCDDAGTIEPTHWMPLPEPPQTEDHELLPAESSTE